MSIWDLRNWADFATIATFLIGGVGYARYICGLRSKSKRLEKYLRREQEKGEDKGERTALQITREISLTPDEIIQASFRNRRIGRRVKLDKDGLATQLLFVYDPLKRIREYQSNRGVK